MKMKHVANRRRSVSSRAFIALLALVLVIGCVAGGTVAWLVAKTDTVVNTLTYGNIDIALTEDAGGTEKQFKIIPGTNIVKDPKVTVTAGSEDCWLFVKVVEEHWPTATLEDGTRKVSYTIADGWTPVEGQTNVYYRVVKAADTVREFPVLKNNIVTVSDQLTKGDIQTAQPKLTFTAYAVQQENIADAAAAWEAANPTTTTNP